MGVKYQSVVNVPTRYRAWLAQEERGTAENRSGPELIADFDLVGGGDEFADLVQITVERQPATAS
jgi:hypothetical protein